MADNDVKIKVSLDGEDQVKRGLEGIGDGASNADSKLGGFLKGGLATAGKALVGFSLAAVGAGTALSAGVIGAYADYEQNIGGIETLFGASAGKMEQYANNAYKTAGLSANEYMSQSTSFAAALLQGLGGDTEKAADVANRAITDMSDNAAKFGSNIGDIQNAYQGFAKQNYTMLDNLKLGYGGTAEEMARLVNESGVLADGVQVDASSINDVSYDQIIAAIGAVQDKMGITGTTAAEASATISGSIDTLKGAWENLLVGLGSADADVGALAKNVVDSLQQVLTNIQPVIQALGSNIATLGPQLGTIAQGLIASIATAIPAIITAGVSLIGGLVQGIISALPSLITAIVPGIVSLVTMVATLAPKLVTAGAQAIASLAIGLGNALPTLIPLMVEGVLGMVMALVEALPMLLGAGITLITGLAEGIISAIPMLIEALPEIINGIVLFLENGIPAVLNAGIALLNGIIDALPTVIAALAVALPQINIAIITALLTAVPQLIQAGIQLFMALITALPQIIQGLIAAIPQIITGLTGMLTTQLPTMIQAGIDMFLALITALPQIIVALVAAIPQIVDGLTTAIVQNWPAISQAGKDLLTKMIEKIGPIVSEIKGAIPQIIDGIVSAIGEGVGSVASAGGDLVRGIWEGIQGMSGWLMGQISGFVDDVVSNIAGFFGVASPSKRMRDEVGQHLPSGIGVGVTDNAQAALRPIQDLNASIMGEASKLNTTIAFTHDATLTQSLVPTQYTTQQPLGPINVEATLDPYLISSAITDSFAANDRGSEQASVTLSRESINTLASAIVDSIRVQSRQGVSLLG